MSLWNQNSNSGVAGFVQSTLTSGGEIFGVVLNDQISLDALADQFNEPPYKAKPIAPAMYIKPRNTVVGSGAAITLPSGENHVEVGAVLGIVIGKAASRLNEETAVESIAGYVVVADLSLPHDSYYRPAIREKCFDGACPMGELVAADRAVDITALEIKTFVNNQLVATRQLSGLLRSIPQLLCAVSEFMTLKPGDILLSGVPFQSPQAKIGDSVRVEVAQIGNVEFTLGQTSPGAEI